MEYMSFRMTCITGAFVLREVILCRRTCTMGGHILQECMSSGWHILEDDVYNCKTYFIGQVLLEDMSDWRPCLTGVHVLQEYIFYRTLALENLRECHNNNSNSNKVTLRPCELLEITGKRENTIIARFKE